MKIWEFFKRDNIGEPPWSYDYLVNLPESEYPRYLAKLFYLNTGEKLPLEWSFRSREWRINKKKCRTFNQKLQYIKLYNTTPLMRDCTDKVKVRDYVAKKIGEEYLKPVLQIIPENNADQCVVIASKSATIQDLRGNPVDRTNKNNQMDCFVTEMAVVPRKDCKLDDVQPKSNDTSTYFDKIEWNKLPNAFVLKCNHGSKWQYIIKNKEEYLNIKPFVEITKRNITGWLEQDYSFCGGFEIQYRGIKPKIIILLSVQISAQKDCLYGSLLRII